MKTPFLNENRTRYYGLRVGDIVQPKSFNGILQDIHKVVELCDMDNNAVIIEDGKGNQQKWVAEWCDVVVKIENQ